MSDYTLKLYVSGDSSRTKRAIATLKEICTTQLEGKYDLVIIDVEKEPQIAEEEKILATPTLIKNLPPPIRRIIGDLSEREKVLLGLDLFPVDGKNS